jgi:hypothetical protein
LGLERLVQIQQRLELVVGLEWLESLVVIDALDGDRLFLPQSFDRHP